MLTPLCFLHQWFSPIIPNSSNRSDRCPGLARPQRKNLQYLSVVKNMTDHHTERTAGFITQMNQEATQGLICIFKYQ